MTSAKVYVSTNVVERLTRPIPPPPPQDNSLQAFDSGRNVVDVASFLHSMKQGGVQQLVNKGSSRKSISDFHPLQITRGSDLEGGIGDGEQMKKQQQESFQQFMARQIQMQTRKEGRIKEVSRS